MSNATLSPAHQNVHPASQCLDVIFDEINFRERKRNSPLRSILPEQRTWWEYLPVENNISLESRLSVSRQHVG
jgi:hypothetical protein